MRTSVVCGLVLVQALAGALVGCGAGGAGADSETGSVSEVNLALTALPSGVQCIQVNVTSGSTTLASQNFAAAANWTGNVGLGTFTRGSVLVGANAYNAACTALAGAAPTWVSDPVSADVQPGRPNPVTLNFRQNFGVSASANFAPNVVDIALGGYSTGLVFADGTVKLVGNIPQPLGLTSVVEVAVGWGHACARKTDGTVWCWGSNYYGEQGNGVITNTASGTPVQVAGISGALRIAAGFYNSCAIVAPYNALKCWGYEASSEYFDNSAGNRTAPGTVRGFGAANVVLGSANLFFVDPGNLKVRSGGDNTYGQLGWGGTAASPYGAVAGDATTASVATGSFHACAADTTGIVRCWGYNGAGQLGQNNQTSSSIPVTLPSPTGVEEVAATDQGSCARTTTGNVYCWGDNSYGQLGDGTNTGRLTPVRVLTGSKKLRGAYNHVCSLQADGSVMCWGGNGSGQLLDGTVVSSPSPIAAKL
jgi:hypothetical protein